MPSEQETEDYVRKAATAGCTIMSEGNYALCDWLFGGGYEKAIEKLFSILPDSWKAAGVTDYEYLAQPIFDTMQRIWSDSHELVDHTWDEARENLGLPSAPSPASKYLDDWLAREGWMEPGEIDLKQFISIKNPIVGASIPPNVRRIALTPEKGPWAWQASKWPEVCDADCENIFRQMLAYIYGKYRVQRIVDGVENTLKYITATLSNTEYSFDPGFIAKSTWVQGYALEAETPEQLRKTDIKGWGAKFYGKRGTINWFHASLTTPSKLDNKDLRLSKVFVLFDSGENMFRSFIQHIHIYDGAHKIRGFDDLSLSGIHNAHLDASNCHFMYPFPRIHSGLGISIGVYFPKHNSDAQISFSTIGADFIASKN